MTVSFAGIIALVFVANAQAASPNLVRDVETVRANCGVGNYLFRDLAGKCSHFPEMTALESDELEVSQASALSQDVFTPEARGDDDLPALLPELLPDEISSWEDQAVFFAPGSAKLSPGEKSKLENLAQWLKTEAQIRVEVQGASGREESANAKLSHARATEVAQALRAAGIPSRQIALLKSNEKASEGARRILIRAESL